MDVAQRPVRKLLLCGLDGSGKTTMIKKYNKKEIREGNSELIMSTPFINCEMIELPSLNKCLVYDMSGQVSAFIITTDNFWYRADTAIAGLSSILRSMEFSLSLTPLI